MDRRPHLWHVSGAILIGRFWVEPAESQKPLLFWGWLRASHSWPRRFLESRGGDDSAPWKEYEAEGLDSHGAQKAAPKEDGKPADLEDPGPRRGDRRRAEPAATGARLLRSILEKRSFQEISSRWPSVFPRVCFSKAARLISPMPP